MADSVGSLRELSGRVDLEWQIKNYSTLQEMEYLDSDIFLLSDATWFLRMKPRGDVKDGSVGCISLFLMKNDSETEKHHIHFTLGIKSDDASEKFAFEEERDFICEKHISEGFGTGVLMSSELMERKDALLVEDTLKIFCVARLVKDIVETASQTVPEEEEDVETLVEMTEDVTISEEPRVSTP